MTTVSFFPQQRPESCVPACLRMVFAVYGVERTEEEIYACCETDSDGTLPSAAARCAQELGFGASAVRLAGLDDLRGCIDTARDAVIAFVNLGPLLGVNVIHAVIIELMDTAHGNMRVIDPAYPPAGYRNWSLGLFEVGWRLARRQCILIMPQS